MEDIASIGGIRNGEGDGGCSTVGRRVAGDTLHGQVVSTLRCAVVGLGLCHHHTLHLREGSIEERGLTRVEVHGVETTLGLVVDAVPVEGIIALVDLTRLTVVLTHGIGQREARGTHERLLAGRFVDLVEFAVHTDSIELACLGDTDGDESLGGRTNRGALAGLVIDRTPLQGVAVGRVEHTIDRAVGSLGCLRGGEVEVVHASVEAAGLARREVGVAQIEEHITLINILHIEVCAVEVAVLGLHTVGSDIDGLARRGKDAESDRLLCRHRIVAIGTVGGLIPACLVDQVAPELGSLACLQRIGDLGSLGDETRGAGQLRRANLQTHLL